jgi:type I restriction enzyme R subunit
MKRTARSGATPAVFDYFVGYKLGLTATPRDYLKRFDKATPSSRDPREAERRLLLETYRTFGCENSQPTYRYSLLDGVKEGFLVNPTVVDARTEITTNLLSEKGFVVTFTDETGDDQTEAYKQREFEKRFFAEATNQLLCKTFLENALRDPVSREIGKSIIFAVSQDHAAKLAHILNQMADRMFPGKYQSDFAVHVTSQIAGAQQFSINFTNNNLLGSANFIPAYKTSKARVCVTVGKMTTGYDCPDILNLGLFRPIFSPTDFIQIKGRGTRKCDFRDQLFDESIKAGVTAPNKTAFKMFDFFANCEYFEEEFKYDQVLKLPRPKNKPGEEHDGDIPAQRGTTYDHLGADIIATIKEETVGDYGMKIDRMFFERFEETVREDATIAAAVESGQWDRVIDCVNKEVFDKPQEYYTLDKLRRAAAVDRRLTLTPEDKGRIAQNFKGYDISPDMVRLSLVNLYLHGFVDPHIYEYDTLTSEERWNEHADVILANPPFMSPKGGIIPHRRFSVQAKRSEVLFVDYMAEHLTPTGRAAIIVPEGIIFQSQTAYVQLRKMLVEEYLVAVVSLPAGCLIHILE